MEASDVVPSDTVVEVKAIENSKAVFVSKSVVGLTDSQASCAAPVESLKGPCTWSVPPPAVAHLRPASPDVWHVVGINNAIDVVTLFIGLYADGVPPVSKVSAVVDSITVTEFSVTVSAPREVVAAARCRVVNKRCSWRLLLPRLVSLVASRIRLPSVYILTLQYYVWLSCLYIGVVITLLPVAVYSIVVPVDVITTGLLVCLAVILTDKEHLRI